MAEPVLRESPAYLQAGDDLIHLALGQLIQPFVYLPQGLALDLGDSFAGQANEPSHLGLGE